MGQESATQRNDNGFDTGDMFDFDSILPVVKQVRHKGQKYELRQATEEASIAYEGQRRRGATVMDGGRLQLSPESAEADLVLVARCLYDQSGKQVHITQLRQWQHDHIETMAEWVKDNTPGMGVNKREDIEQEIARLQKRLRDMDGQPSLESQAKNSPAAT